MTEGMYALIGPPPPGGAPLGPVCPFLSGSVEEARGEELKRFVHWMDSAEEKLSRRRR